MQRMHALNLHFPAPHILSSATRRAACHPHMISRMISRTISCMTSDQTPSTLPGQSSQKCSTITLQTHDGLPYGSARAWARRYATRQAIASKAACAATPRHPVGLYSLRGDVNYHCRPHNPSRRAAACPHDSPPLTPQAVSPHLPPVRSEKPRRVHGGIPPTPPTPPLSPPHHRVTTLRHRP